MKARRVKGLDPAAPLVDNLERIVRVRLAELLAFMPRAADPDKVEALHDMRIAAKRLRYILEIAHPCFGDYARSAVNRVKDLQELLGELHDCDVQSIELEAFLAGLISEDALALALAADGMDDLAPEALRVARHRDDHAGVAALLVYIRARRRVLFGAFERLWAELERGGFAARLQYAVTERPPLPRDQLPGCDPA